MAKRKQPFNPFYAALILVGVAFTITACGYALMMLRATRPDSSDSSETSVAVEAAGLMTLLDERGMEILGVEVLLLAVATAGAIGLDQYRQSRSNLRTAIQDSRLAERHSNGQDSLHDRN